MKNYNEVSEPVQKKKINLLFKDIKKVIPNEFDNLMDTYLTYGDGANRVYKYLESGKAMKKVTKIIKKSLIQAPSKELIAYVMLSNNVSYRVITSLKQEGNLWMIPCKTYIATYIDDIKLLFGKEFHVKLNKDKKEIDGKENIIIHKYIYVNKTISYFNLIIINLILCCIFSNL